VKGNPFEAMKQLKKIQEKMAKIDEELEQTLVEGTAVVGL
jgi:Uncharacterised BCR, YbaB family COG0718.